MTSATELSCGLILVLVSSSFVFYSQHQHGERRLGADYKIQESLTQIPRLSSSVVSLVLVMQIAALQHKVCKGLHPEDFRVGWHRYMLTKVCAEPPVGLHNANLIFVIYMLETL